MISFTLPPPGSSSSSASLSNVQIVANALHSSPIVAIGILTWADGFSRSAAFRTDEVRSLFPGLLSLARIASYHHHSSSLPGAVQCVRSALALTSSMLSSPPSYLGLEQASLFRKLCLRNLVCFAARGLPLEVLDYLACGVASEREAASTFDHLSASFSYCGSSWSSDFGWLDTQHVRNFVEDLVSVVAPDASSLSADFAYALLRFFALGKCQSAINSDFFKKEGTSKIEAVRAVIAAAAKRLGCAHKVTDDFLKAYK